jgi:PHD/YefM family antitoxin component YafN of YafNO toxin-antitoxin module
MTMKKTYTFSEARQKFATVLDTAEQTGEVRVIRKNGSIFVIRPEKRKRSLLDVEGIDVDIPAEEIVRIIREGRERPY